MIKGETLILRRAVRADIPRFLKWQTDEEVSYLSGGRFIPQEDLERKLSQPFPESLLFIIQIKERPIGYLSFYNIRWKDRIGEFGVVIGEKDCWNKLYGLDVYATFLDYAFNTLNMHKLYGTVVEYNERPIRLIEKGGGNKEGILKEYIFKDGRYYDMYMYSFSQKEYLEAKEKASKEGLKKFWLWRKKDDQNKGIDKGV
jgi:RimJ/RimL family protein N-acetyltransferase